MLDLKVSEKQGGGEPEPWYAGIRVQTVTAPERIVQSEFDALQVAGAPKNGKMDFRYQTQLVAPTAAQAIAQFKFALAHGELAGRHLCLRQAINGFIGEAAFTLLPELPPEVALDGRPLVFCNIGEQGRERTPGTHVVTLRSKLSGDLVAYENLASVEAWDALENRVVLPGLDFHADQIIMPPPAKATPPVSTVPTPVPSCATGAEAEVKSAQEREEEILMGEGEKGVTVVDEDFVIYGTKGAGAHGTPGVTGSGAQVENGDRMPGLGSAATSEEEPMDAEPTSQKQKIKPFAVVKPDQPRQLNVKPRGKTTIILDGNNPDTSDEEDC